MPVGYLITSGGMAAVATSAVLGHRPRGSSPFRLSYLFGLWLNWPLLTFVLLVASTALAIDQSGVDSAGLWIGVGLTGVASVELAVLHRRGRGTGAVLERALDEGLGTDWRDHGVPRAPTGRRGRVARSANIRYGPARRANLLDLYRDRSDGAGRPALVYFHARRGSKRLGARRLLRRLAADGWVCISANYRIGPAAGFADSLLDVEHVIAWLREHGETYGVDPGSIFLAGSSLGALLASLAALRDPSIAGVIGLYGYYGSLPAADAPPFFVAHGDLDTLVPVDAARGFVERLRAASSSPVVYAELPAAQHGFDLIRSRRFDAVVDAIAAFAAFVRSPARDRATVVSFATWRKRG
jgi:acetyl esterase/lipase